MGYFEHVQRKTEETKPYASVASMVERVEQRAYEMLSPKEQQATEYACVDPYVVMSPQDSALWVVALTKAREMDKEFYVRLYYMRGLGTQLVRHQRWGYVLRPLITGDSANGWLNQAAYEEEKRCLEPYAQQLIQLLQMLAYGSDA